MYTRPQRTQQLGPVASRPARDVAPADPLAGSLVWQLLIGSFLTSGYLVRRNIAALRRALLPGIPLRRPGYDRSAG